MLKGIEEMNVPKKRRERLQIVYDFFATQIEECGGLYKMPSLRILAPNVYEYSRSTLGEDLNVLVLGGLLNREGSHNPTFSMPDIPFALLEEPEPPVLELTEEDLCSSISLTPETFNTTAPPARIVKKDEGETTPDMKAVMNDALNIIRDEVKLHVVDLNEELHKESSRVEELARELNTLTDVKVVEGKQATVDQFIHINTWLITLKYDNLDFGDVISAVRRIIKGVYHLPLKVKTTEIPSRMLPLIYHDLREAVINRLNEDPDYFYRLEDKHQDFLILHGYHQL